MATYWENSCSFGLRYVSWYKYLIVSLVFSHLGFWSGNLFLIAPFPDLCLLVPFQLKTSVVRGSIKSSVTPSISQVPTLNSLYFSVTAIEKYFQKIHILTTISLATTRDKNFVWCFVNKMKHI